MNTDQTAPADAAGQPHAPQEAPAPVSAPTIKDRAGRTFDPAKHAAKPDGTPRLDRNGKFYSVHFGKRQIPAAARPAPATAPAVPVVQAQPTGAPEPAPKFDDIEKAAAGGADMPDASPAMSGASGSPSVETCIGVIQTALVLIGAEEGILSDQEKILLRIPLKRVLDKYNVGADVMPAEVDLAFAVASLLIVRIQRPKTATWFAKVKAWAANRWFGWKGTRLAQEVRQGVAT